MGRSMIATLGLVAVLVLSFFCAHCHRDGIESDLTGRASAGLASAGLGHLKVTAEGRDLTLAGDIASEDDRRLALETSRVYGVRVVQDAMRDAPTPAAPQVGTAWSLDASRSADRGLEWTGTAASSSVAELADDAAPFLDGVRLSVETSEDPTAQWTDEQRAAIRAALPFLATVEASGLTASPQGLIFRGAPSSLRQAQAVRRALAPRMPEGMALTLEWDRQWSADELALEIANRDERWDLSGLVPSGTAASWGDRAKAAGLEPLDNALIEAEVTAPADFGVGFGGALASLDGLPGARLVESDGALDFSGLSDDAALAEKLRGQVEASLPASTDLRFLVAPKLESADCQGQLETELAAEKILFASGSAALDARSDALLRRLSTTLRRCPTASVRIEGHTDSDGEEAFNQVLSTRRADAVKRRMVALGVDPLRLEAEGFGEGRPIAEGDSPQAKSQNRRIEFRLQEDA